MQSFRWATTSQQPPQPQMRRTGESGHDAPGTTTSAGVRWGGGGIKVGVALPGGAAPGPPSRRPGVCRCLTVSYCAARPQRLAGGGGGWAWDKTGGLTSSVRRSTAGPQGGRCAGLCWGGKGIPAVRHARRGGGGTTCAVYEAPIPLQAEQQALVGGAGGPRFASSSRLHPAAPPAPHGAGGGGGGLCGNQQCKKKCGKNVALCGKIRGLLGSTCFERYRVLDGHC